MTTLKQGTQIWNDDKTQGYEVTRDINPGEVISASDFMALGDAPKAVPHTVMPKWVFDVLIERLKGAALQ